MSEENNQTWDSECPECKHPSTGIPKRVDMIGTCPGCGIDVITKVNNIDGVDVWSIAKTDMSMSRLFDDFLRAHRPGVSYYEDDDDDEDFESCDDDCDCDHKDNR